VFRVVIPARYGSTRLPGKPLLDVAGKPLLQWVHERASRSGAAQIVIATDDERIRRCAMDFGAEVQLTAASHATGTDRIAEVAAQRGWKEGEVVVNVQGDEPLIDPRLIDQVAGLLLDHDEDMATLAAPVTGLEAFLDPNVVKVVTDLRGRALYFSRAPVPWNRDAAPAGLASQRDGSAGRRHIGIYAYRVAALRCLATLAPTPLEQIERLEQLRALENGLSIRVADALVPPGADVNTAEDLRRVTELLRT
jgi:3-deoxy-manno-octulosonate cytidylyltransferase (CMP-KDO synthetase)